MRLTVDSQGDILLEKVFSGVSFKTAAGETLAVCMRDAGFEVNYQGRWWSLQNGSVQPLHVVEATAP